MIVTIISTQLRPLDAIQLEVQKTEGCLSECLRQNGHSFQAPSLLNLDIFLESAHLH